MKAPRGLALIALMAALLHPVSAAPGLPEYTAAEAPKHIGEKATVVGKVGCIDAGRTFHMLDLDGCSPNSPFWIVVNDNASGPELNIQDLKGVTIAVTGKIERPQTQPWLVVKSTTQIQPRSALHTDHISRGNEKDAQGDPAGAIEEFGQAIEQQPDRRKEAYGFIARIKEKKGDWDGALAAYDDLVRLDPNDSNSYWERATAKEHHGDFEAAMADFTRAAELRSSGANFIDIGNRRKAHGDLAGAMATYDKAIAMLDNQIAGMQKPSDRLDLLFYQRGYAKELKGDVDGAVADYSQAIAIKPSYEAGAYSRRGDIKKARGDLSGAIADYQFAVKYAQLPEDNEKLKKAKAEVEREQAPLADSKSVYGDDKATAKLTRTAHGRAASEQHANSDAADDAESPTALVTRAKLRIRTGDFDGAIADCDRALQLSRGGSKEASGLRIQAMRAKGSSKSAVAQRVNPGRSQEEQPIAPTTKSGPPVAAGEARPKANSALLVDPTSGQPIGRETYNGSVKVEYSDGRSETFCKDGNCTHPHVSHEGHVGWTHYTHREGRYNAAMNERLVIRFSNGQTKEFKPNPNGGPFIEEWNFIDNDVAVAIKSRGYHGAASFVRYDLISGRMTGHQDGYVEYEKMPEWAQPFSDDRPFGLRAPTTEPSPVAKGRDGDHASLPLTAQQTERVASTTEAASPQSSSAGTNILGSQPDLACKYVAQGSEVKRLHGYVERCIGDRILLEGNVDLPTSMRFQGPSWQACIDSAGRLLWSVRGEQQPDVGSLAPRATNGDSILSSGLLNNGTVQLAKFEATTLHMQASVQIPFEPAKTNRPNIQVHSETEGDSNVQVSVTQLVGDSVRVALFSSDLHLIFDNVYAFPAGNSRALAVGAYLGRVADHSGYYFFFRRPLQGGAKSDAAITIVRLDNAGAIKWANTYATGSADVDVEPHQTSDGCILITVPLRTAKSFGSTFIKIGPDGKVNWSIASEGVTLGWSDFQQAGVPYRFIQPYLFLVGMRFSSGKLSAGVLAANYGTGKIEKQVTCNFPGGIGFVEKTSDSIYVSVLDTGRSLRPGASQAGLLRFDFDLNLRAAKSVRNAEPHWPLVRAAGTGKFLSSYSYDQQKTVVVEATDENFESANSCGLLQKANYSVTRSNIITRSVDIVSRPFTSIVVSDANRKTSDGDSGLALAPLDLKAAPCTARENKGPADRSGANQDYFIYSSRDSVFFHSRVKE